VQVHLEEFGESYYNEMIPGVIQELQGKGLLVEDQGATIMWCGGSHQLPLMVRKSDGGFGWVGEAATPYLTQPPFSCAGTG
jgi:arginyl-tRNA synthetase